MVSAAELRKRDGVRAADARFHTTLFELAGDQMLTEIVSGLRTRIGGFLWIATRSLSHSELMEHAESHHALLDTIVRGDEQSARSAIRDHITLAAERIARSLETPLH